MKHGTLRAADPERPPSPRPHFASSDLRHTQLALSILRAPPASLPPPPPPLLCNIFATLLSLSPSPSPSLYYLCNLPLPVPLSLSLS